MAPLDKSILSHFEQEIREGRAAPVLTSIRESLAHRRPERSLLLPLAQLARRAGAPTLSLQLLRPLVRPSAKVPREATSAERSEYAAALIWLGVLPEALRLLDRVNVAEVPEASLNRAFALFKQWNYEEAIPHLERYLAAPLTDYQKLVGRLNLAAALSVAGREPKALLAQLRFEAREKGLTRILDNTLELSAQLAVFSGDHREAEEFIAEAMNLTSALPLHESLYVRKWRAVIAARSQEAGELHLIRVEAEAHGEWETVRDAEMHLALNTHDEKALARVYFGTPYASFRKRLLQMRVKGLALPSDFTWLSGRKRATLDLTTRAALAERGLKPDQLVTKLLLALFTDFFKPFDVSALHGLLFPDDYFEPVSSAMRIHQLVRRLRFWIEEQGLDLDLNETRGGYRIKAGSGLAVRLPATLFADLKMNNEQRLRSVFQSERFSLAEAAESIMVPPRSLSRQLQVLVEAGHLRVFDRARATRYAFAP